VRLRLEALEERTVPTTFLVTSTADTGPGTLRQAIMDANAATGSNLIAFNISAAARTIRPLSELPPITGQVSVDGTTQPGYSRLPLIVLEGNKAGTANGLTFQGSGDSIKALVISDFSQGAAIILGGPGGDSVANCWIGTDATGTSGVLNRVGISITSPNNVVGGSGAVNTIGHDTTGIQIDGDNNVIAANRIGTDATGSFALNNVTGVAITGSNNTVGGMASAAGNLISGNTEGVSLDPASSGNLILGNKVGLDLSGLSTLGNVTGVHVSGTNNTVGGTVAGAGNVISGNTGKGVLLDGGSGNVVAGNRIGIDPTGFSAVPNAVGVYFSASMGNTVGGTTAGARNIISGNTGAGVQIDADSSANVVEGNYLGTDSTGSSALANERGVEIDGSGNMLGGPAGAVNVISGNTNYGVFIGGAGNVVQGNLIGLDSMGFSALSNSTGILLAGPNNVVGGSVGGAGNTISGNLSAGVGIVADGNLLEGNQIGTDGTGSNPLVNGLDLDILGSNNMVGGGATGAGNVITGSATDGILIDGGSGNSIRGNSIFGNAGLGIHLINGGNNNQAAPVLASAISSGGVVALTGSLTGVASTVYTLELFAADPNDPNQGQVSLGTVAVSTDDTGQVTFSLTLSLAISPGQYLTATATDSSGNTSMFAQGVLVM
jgi:hypothetical protein